MYCLFIMYLLFICYLLFIYYFFIIVIYFRWCSDVSDTHHPPFHFDDAKSALPKKTA